MVCDRFCPCVVHAGLTLLATLVALRPGAHGTYEDLGLVDPGSGCWWAALDFSLLPVLRWRPWTRNVPAGLARPEGGHPCAPAWVAGTWPGTAVGPDGQEPPWARPQGGS